MLNPSTGTRLAMMCKAVVEWCLALVLAVIALPFVLFLAALVWVDSGGPVFYRDKRVGRNGRHFTMLKLRTLVRDAPYRSDKTPDDDRMTRVGRGLRRYSADELPQLWNVLCGDMALIGPRPYLLCEVEQHSAAARQRQRVKPGMTGLWQVSGRSDLPMAERIALDLRYIRDWTLWMDLRIAARTLPSVIRAKGAY